MRARTNPFAELERVFDRMMSQFDESSRYWDPDGPLGRWSSEVESMAIDLVEHDDEFVITVDLPGYGREEVDLRVTDHTLRIEAEHEERIIEEEERYLRQERHHESTKRSVRLPEEVDKEAVKARMKNGVLTITLPKIVVEEAQEIEIESE